MKKGYTSNHCRGRNIMPQFKNIENRKNITYELANDDSQLTKQDTEKLFKLLKKIEEGKSISEKLKKRNYNTQKLLTAKIIYNENFHLTFEKKEKAETEVLFSKEKMVSTRRLISVDWSLLNGEDIDNFNPTMIEHAEEKRCQHKD